MHPNTIVSSFLSYTGPQIVISVYGNNSLGRDEVRGYGSKHLPIVPGRYIKNGPDNLCQIHVCSNNTLLIHLNCC